MLTGKKVWLVQVLTCVVIVFVTAVITAYIVFAFISLRISTVTDYLFYFPSVLPVQSLQKLYEEWWLLLRRVWSPGYQVVLPPFRLASCQPSSSLFMSQSTAFVQAVSGKSLIFSFSFVLFLDIIFTWIVFLEFGHYHILCWFKTHPGEGSDCNAVSKWVEFAMTGSEAQVTKRTSHATWITLMFVLL